MTFDSGALLALALIGAVAVGLYTRRRVTGLPLRMSLTRPGATLVHQRLRRDLDRAGRAVARARRRDLPVQVPAGVLDDARTRAEDLEARIVTASRLPFTARQRELLVLRREAAQLRRVAVRIEQLATELVTPSAATTPVAELHGRLDALDAARRDAHALSRRWGTPAT